MRLVTGVLATALLVSPVAAQNVLDAEPVSRVDSNDESTSRQVLPALERAKNRILIIKKDGKYLWASREGRELRYYPGDAVHVFADVRGSGYIKVFDSHFLPDSVRAEGPRYRFMEHVNLILTTITYWGTTDRFRP